MAKYEIVKVTWHDAHAENEWQDTSQIDSEPFVVVTVGWLIPNIKPNHIVIAQSIGDDDAVDGVLSIPLGMVVSKEILSVANEQLSIQ